MPNITLVNTSNENIFLRDLYITLAPGQSSTFFRTVTALMQSTGIQEVVAAGDVTMSLAYTAEELASEFDIFPGFTGGAATPVLPRTRFIEVDAPEGDGSQGHPYNQDQIQDAINDLIALGPTSANPVFLQFGAGTFLLPVGTSIEIHYDGFVILGRGRAATRVQSEDAPVIITTNATPASLATYKSTGTYSDLVYNPGDPVPTKFALQSIDLTRVGTTGPVIQLLGVKGDAGATKTNFGYDYANNAWFSFIDIEVHGPGIPFIFAKNVGWLWCEQIWSGYTSVFENCYIVQFDFSNPRGLELSYDAASPDGTPFYGHYYFYMRNAISHDVNIEGGAKLYTSNTNYDDVTVNDNATLDAHNCHIDLIVGNDSAHINTHSGHTGKYTLNDTAVGVTHGTTPKDDLVAAGGATFTGNGSHIEGDLDLAAGAGVITLNGGEYMGTNVGAGAARLVRNVGS